MNFLKANTNFFRIRTLIRCNTIPNNLHRQIVHPNPPFHTLIRKFHNYRPNPYTIRPPWNFGALIVPEQTAYIIERFGQYSKTLTPGLHFLAPIINRVAHVQSLKEQTIPIPSHSAITKDNVRISVDGVLYMKIVDPVLASYGGRDAIDRVVEAVQSTMSTEFGKFTIDKAIEEPKGMNKNVLDAVNSLSPRENWGLECRRCEIKDINPSDDVKEGMHLQAEAERKRRVELFSLEAEQQVSNFNAETEKMCMDIELEGRKIAEINRAEAEAEANLIVAKAAMESMEKVSEAIVDLLIAQESEATVDMKGTKDRALSRVRAVINAIRPPNDSENGGGFNMLRAQVAAAYKTARYGDPVTELLMEVFVPQHTSKVSVAESPHILEELSRSFSLFKI